jgi:hypothetical protein
MNLLKQTLFGLFLTVSALLFAAYEAQAGGCFSTTPSGDCVKWDQGDPVVWRPETGPLKGPPSEDGGGGGGGGGCNLVPEAQAIDVSNTQAVEIIQRSFDRWENVPLSQLDIQQGPPLNDGGDVNFTNLENFWIGSFITGETSTVDASGCYDTDPATECLNPVIFDHSGLVTQAIQGQCSYCFILGFAAILPETDDDSPQFTITNSTLRSSQAVVSGACLEPEVNDPFCPSNCCPTGIDLDVVEGTMTHEIGHFLGLDHTLTNKQEYLDCTDDDGCSAQALEDIPTMIGLFVEGADLKSLHQDDISTFAKIYPDTQAGANNFSDNTCSISGYVVTGIGTEDSGRCLEVVARRQGDTRSIAVAVPAGEFAPRVTQGVQNTSGTAGKNFDNCVGNASTCGAFVIDGLPAGTYTVDVQALSDPPQTPFNQWAQEPCIPPRAGASILDNPDATGVGPNDNLFGPINCTAGNNTAISKISSN